MGSLCACLGTSSADDVLEIEYELVGPEWLLGDSDHQSLWLDAPYASPADREVLLLDTPDEWRLKLAKDG